MSFVSSSRLYQLFKYAVYAALTLNIFLFYAEESAAVALQYPQGINLGNVREAFSASLDTFAWVVLLLMFELETSVLEDRHFTPGLTIALRAMRAVGYALILMAFAGYIDDMLFVSDTVAFTGTGGLCALPPGEWSWAIMFGEYVPITAANCASLSEVGGLVQFRDLPILVDAAGHTEIVRLAWADVINAAAWILVVFILEIDVWLQEHHRYEGAVLYASNACKLVLYSTLMLVAIYWTFKGDFLDVWDAYMWLVAFFFIEMNVFEWRAGEHAAA